MTWGNRWRGSACVRTRHRSSSPQAHSGISRMASIRSPGSWPGSFGDDHRPAGCVLVQAWERAGVHRGRILADVMRPHGMPTPIEFEKMYAYPLEVA
jgi:hypothetical protein